MSTRELSVRAKEENETTCFRGPFLLLPCYGEIRTGAEHGKLSRIRMDGACLARRPSFVVRLTQASLSPTPRARRRRACHRFCGGVDAILMHKTEFLRHDAVAPRAGATRARPGWPVSPVHGPRRGCSHPSLRAPLPLTARRQTRALEPGHVFAFAQTRIEPILLGIVSE